MTDPPERRPPYRIVTARLILRCEEPSVASLVKAARDASREHCRPFLEWARQGPLSVEETVRRLRRSRAMFDRDEGYAYYAVTKDERAVVGGAGIHSINRFGDLDVGYWVAAGHLGRGFAVEMGAALTRVVLEIFGVERVELRASLANPASQRVAERLGYRKEAVLARRIPTEDGGRDDVLVYTMFANEYSRSAAALVPCECFDATDDIIPLR